jgi:hypothetical protein
MSFKILPILFFSFTVLAETDLQKKCAKIEAMVKSAAQAEKGVEESISHVQKCHFSLFNNVKKLWTDKQALRGYREFAKGYDYKMFVDLKLEVIQFMISRRLSKEIPLDELARYLRDLDDIEDTGHAYSDELPTLLVNLPFDDKKVLKESVQSLASWNIGKPPKPNSKKEKPSNNQSTDPE